MKERIQWIDEAKGIGILLVMFGHCYLHWDFCFWFYSLNRDRSDVCRIWEIRD